MNQVAEDLDKAAKIHNEETEDTGHTRAKSGSEKAHEDSAKRYRDKETSAQTAEGEDFTRDEGHRKGHKTTGFHNVYRKDKFKKDTTFYDDEHEAGQQEQYGRGQREHADAEGGHEKVERVDTAYEQEEAVRRGYFTNGHQYGVARGHDREEAHEEFHDEGHRKHGEAEQEAGEEREESSSSVSRHWFA